MDDQYVWIAQKIWKCQEIGSDNGKVGKIEH